ncbi:MAG: hypothetical protein GY716_21060 [bacterium]|nr:hypothetical protein [bacterium]
MLSLRSFHLFFILLVTLGADLFGIWAVWHWTQFHDPWILAMGVVALLGGLGLVFYGVKQVKSFDRANIV